MKHYAPSGILVGQLRLLSVERRAECHDGASVRGPSIGVLLISGTAAAEELD